MITKSDGYHRIIEVNDGRSRQQKSIADGIINRHDEIVFMSITQLASFLGAVEAIVRAQRIHIFGNGGNKCLASRLAFRLSRFKLRAIQQSDSGKNLFEKLLEINEDDLVIAYHFHKATIASRRLMDVCAERSVPVLLATDSPVPPVTRHATFVLIANRGTAGTFHSQVVPLAVNSALINAVASQFGDEVVRALQELAEMRQRHPSNAERLASLRGSAR